MIISKYTVRAGKKGIFIYICLFLSHTAFGQLGESASFLRESKGQPYESGVSTNGTVFLNYVSDKPHPDGGTYEETSSYFFNDQNICIGSFRSTPIDVMGILIEQFDKRYTKLGPLHWKNDNIAIFFSESKSGGVSLYIGYIDQMSKIK
jgi:hypothetical protein